jgi:bifunctional aspartokinase / homoserine dehydrogenase 1
MCAANIKLEEILGQSLPGRVGATRHIDVALIGASGRVGRRVLELLQTRQRALLASGLCLRLVAVANSRGWLIAREGIAPEQAVERLANEGAAVVGFADAVGRLPQPLVLLDCSASAEVVSHYPHWLAAGIDVVTPNKLGPSADWPLARAISSARAVTGATLRDSTTVGAQLPLLDTLRALEDAGDRVLRFEAVLSGTLSYVLGSLSRGTGLAQAVREAVVLGYAEPHPGRDLSGEDAARKLVILLRALGQDIQLSDVECVPLVDVALLDEPDAPSLLNRLEAADETWRARAAVAQARRERWIYRASFERSDTGRGRARIAPERVPIDHPLARLAPCENALILHSDYYRAAPLHIAGPGAGTDLTAAGVFADLLATARQQAIARTAIEIEDLVEAAA